ncbi:MAG: hypothetical protein M2R45_02505 [Verrucomicrobia subdivision 3 bacterium]|nr:hypothetical protein [Limisphaerales bacterium]MCS1413295.1 hypothetical protein [Limisphaerales bacterium]
MDFFRGHRIAAENGGAKAILSTVAVHLCECLALVSLRGSALSETQMETWKRQPSAMKR